MQSPAGEIDKQFSGAGVAPLATGVKLSDPERNPLQSGECPIR